MTTQWPQQFQPAHTQSYIPYQQQYHQQHPPHHQGFAAHSNGAYPSAYPPEPQPGHVKLEAQPTPNSCYNCGSPDHWAQSCPEPKREVPVGEIYRQNFTRPPKRQKPNAPIITKYPVPPYVQQNIALNQYYGAAPSKNSAYPSHQGHHFPPTPVSAHSPSQMQWQQPVHHQQYPHQYQHGGYYQQGNHYQNSYPTPTAQTPGPFYNSYHTNQQSHNRAPSYNRPFKQATHQHVQPYGFQGQSFATASPSSAISPSNGYPPAPNHDVMRTSHETVQQGPPSLNQSMQPYSSKPRSPPAELTQSQPEEDDLNALDIPDIPPSSKFLGDEMIFAGHASFCLVKRPLPSNFIVADAIAPFESSRAEDRGRCESKYWPKGGLEKLYQHVKDSSDWVDVSNDPIFLTIPEESEVVPLEDLTSLYNQTHSDDGNVDGNEDGNEDGREEMEAQIQEEGEASRSLQDGERKGDFMDSLEHALGEGRRKQPEQNGNATNTSQEPVESHTNTEELLASLGVTGTPKPVRAPARPYPPPSLEQQGQVPSDNTNRQTSRSPSRQLAQDRHFKSSSGIKSEHHDYEEGDTWKHTHLYNDRYTPHESKFTSRNMHGSSERSYPREFEQPLVSVVHKHSFSEGVGIRPLSAEQNLGNHPLFADPVSTNGTSYNRQSMVEQYNSPVKTYSERLNGRKREYDHRDSSDEGEAPGRRQIDDFTPKLKRRQPKVAEAYSLIDDEMADKSAA